MSPKPLGYIDIPEGQSGNCRIEHRIIKKGDAVVVRSAREALFGGGKAESYLAPHDLRIHYLVEEGVATWTTDLPQEIRSQLPCIEDFHGDVLVGGLGVGLIVAALGRNPKVHTVTVVEQSPDVIKLVWEHLLNSENDLLWTNKTYNVVQADLFQYLRDYKASGARKFACAYYDIWCPNSEDVLFTHIRPLRELSKGVVFDKVYCWQEDVMQGQMRYELLSTIEIAQQAVEFAPIVTLSEKDFADARQFTRTRWPFWAWYRETKPTVEAARKMANIYADDYARNTRRWKRLFGQFEGSEVHVNIKLPPVPEFVNLSVEVRG